MEIQPIKVPECIGCQDEPGEFFYSFKAGRGLPLGMNCISELQAHFCPDCRWKSVNAIPENYGIAHTPPITHIQWITHTSHVGAREHPYGDDCGLCDKTEPGNGWWDTKSENRPV